MNNLLRTLRCISFSNYNTLGIARTIDDKRLFFYCFRVIRMHIEVQVALNFVISYLYNKLPRRRVNIFGEELEKALKDKFRGHWYPERPCRGSAFRCLKTGGPLDPVLERAARESGIPVQDVLEHLPRELAVWVDPGKCLNY